MSTDRNILLRQVRVLDPVSRTDRIADVLLTEGKIKAIEENLTVSEDAVVWERKGCILAPGLVDLYCHSGEPGHEQRETLVTLAAAGAAGGFTRLTILPDTVPPVDNPAGLTLLERKTRTHRTAASAPHFSFWGALTVNLEGKQMTELAELGSAGAIGFADGYPLENLGLVRRLLEYLQPLGKPVALVANDRQIQSNGVMREGPASIRYGLPGSPAAAETAAIAAILELVGEIGTPVHVMRVSTARGVELIGSAKDRGIPVTASTTWMHLLLDANAIASYDPNLRLEPPLGNPEDLEALVEGVKEGVIDAIATDSSPYTYEEKTVSFAEAPPGAIGLELALPLLWERFVATNEWSALKLWQALSTEPQRCLQREPQACIPGATAELVLFDPQQTWTVLGSTLQSRAVNTPWLGKEIAGKVVRIWS